MKLLLLLPRGVYGTRDLLLQRELRAAGINALFIYMTDARDHELQGQDLARRVVPMRGRLDVGSILRLRKIVREFAPDLIHAYTAKLGWLAIASQWPAKRSKFILHRGAIRELNRWSPSDQLLFRSKWINAYECISQAVADSLMQQGVEASQLRVIFPGFLSEKLQTNAMRPITNGGGKIRIGSIANYRRIKGLEYLVDAADILQAHGLDFELVLVGRDPHGELAACVNKARARDRIRCVGFTPSPAAMLNTFDLTVIPSLSEGLCKAAVESLGCGVPVIATRVGGLPEFVQNGRNGMLVKPADPDAIATAVLELVRNPALRRRFRENGLRTFVEKFSMQSRCASLVEFYRKVAVGP